MQQSSHGRVRTGTRLRQEPCRFVVVLQCHTLPDRRAAQSAKEAEDPTVQVYLYHFSFVFESLFTWPFTDMGAFHGSELV